MSEQTKIIAQMQELVMEILKTGIASEEQGRRLDDLEALLDEQKCFLEIDSTEYDCQGEEIAGLFLNDKYEEAIEKMYTCGITPEDFFGFVNYHYEEENEELNAMCTNSFVEGVTQEYARKSK